MILLELLAMWLMPVQTGPLCPHAHSILIFTSPLFTSQSVLDALTALPTGTAWLCHPSLDIRANWLWFRLLSNLHVHFKHRPVNIHSSKDSCNHIQCIHNDINYINKRGRMDLLSQAYRKAKGYIHPDEFTDLEKNPKTMEQQVCSSNYFIFIVL